MKVLVTGANGFLGLNIVEALLESGHRVHAFIRPSSRTTYLDGFGVDCHRGELGDSRALLGAMDGKDAVIHCAGNTSGFPADFKEQYATNVLGTASVAEAARRAGVKRLVYTSTTSTIGAADDPRTQSDESTPLRGFRARSQYAISKRLAEEKALEAGVGPGMETVVVNPGEVIGAYDHNFQWGRMILAVVRDEVPFVPPGSASFCHAREVGRGHVTAMERGRAGSRYILAGVNHSFAELMDGICRVTQSRITPRWRPYSLLRPAIWSWEKLLPLTGKAPPIDYHRMRVMGGHYLFSSEKAERELGYRKTGIEDMVEAAYRWYQRVRLI